MQDLLTEVEKGTFGPPGTYFIYIALPYSDGDKEGRERRMEISTRAARALLALRVPTVYAPITHSHPMDVLDDQPMPPEVWYNFDAYFMNNGAACVVLTFGNWENSRGVTMERNAYETTGRPVYYVDPAELLPNHTHLWS